MNRKLELTRTGRGFARAAFVDQNGVKCSLQESSAATEDCIWLGADDIGLKHFKAGEGWEDVPLPQSMQEHYIANTRMHLNRDQVRALLPLLHRFVETGEL